jgi:hypothetical protein
MMLNAEPLVCALMMLCAAAVEVCCANAECGYCVHPKQCDACVASKAQHNVPGMM